MHWWLYDGFQNDCAHTHTNTHTYNVEANFSSLHFDTIVMYLEGSCFSVKFFIPTYKILYMPVLSDFFPNTGK